jgi:hypothetical protein
MSELIVDFSVMGCILVGFGMGWLFGTTYEADKLMKMNREQQKRGDYWYNKYMRQVDTEWEWIGEWED